MGSSRIEKEKIFIVAGFPRTGTTFLYHNLQKHPLIFTPYRKELAFFIYYYSKGYDWYLNHFTGMKPGQIALDVSSLYLLNQTSIERIKQFNPAAKIIVGVRDPVEFALSMYAQIGTYSLNPPPFEDFIINFSFNRINKKHNFQLVDNFIPRTLETIKKTFGDNLLLYSYDIFKENTLTVLRAIESFVGISPYFDEKKFDNVVINPGNRKNIRIVSSLLVTGDIFPRVLRYIFPPSLIQLVKSKLDKSVSKNQNTRRQSYPSKHVRLAEKAFSEQRRYCENLFSKFEIQLGSGTPFEF